MRLVTAILDRIIELATLFACVLLVFIMVSVGIEVVMRYFFGRPQLWVSEITEVALLYIAFLGTAWVLKREGHVKIDMLISRLKPQARSWLTVITSVIGVGICCVLVWYGTKVTWDSFQKSLYEPTIMELPTGPIMIIIPLGSFLLLIQFLRRTYSYLSEVRSVSPTKTRSPR